MPLPLYTMNQKTQQLPFVDPCVPCVTATQQMEIRNIWDSIKQSISQFSSTKNTALIVELQIQLDGDDTQNTADRCCSRQEHHHVIWSCFSPFRFTLFAPKSRTAFHVVDGTQKQKRHGLLCFGFYALDRKLKHSTDRNRDPS